MLDWNAIMDFATQGNPEPPHRVDRSEAQWRDRLTEHQYQVTRLKGTERPFSSGLCEAIEPGRYACICCDSLLFDASEKFASGSGWPSFTQPASVNAVAYYLDDSHGMQRIETLCNVCDAHLGHVFPDGPPPSGLRYCINAVALKKMDEDNG